MNNKFFINLKNFYYKNVNYMNFILRKVEFSKNYYINGIIFIRNYGKLIIGENFKANSGINKKWHDTPRLMPYQSLEVSYE